MPTYLNDLNRRAFLKQLAGTGSAALMLTAPSLFSSRAWAAQESVVEIVSGKLRGSRIAGVHGFLGVRYGESTAGLNRFMPPQKAKPWTGVRDAQWYGNSAPQTNPSSTERRAATEVGALIFDKDGEPPPESEDCLFLNVWTAGVGDNKKRPVMFWLHGGGFETGSDSNARFIGDNLARRGDIVVVGINHRLGALGYTHLGDLGDPAFARATDVGMLDAILALQWVHDNIERFGGDPNQVTIFGQSGGGQKVSMLLGSPLAKGLFHRAIVQSGPGIRFVERARATEIAGMLLSELGLNAKRLRDAQTLPVEQMLKAQYAVNAKLMRTPGIADGFSPVLDPQVLPVHPFEPQATSLSADIPLLIGGTKTEMTAFVGADTAAFSLDEAGLKARVEKLLGSQNAQNVIDAYRRETPDATPSDLYFYIATDNMMTLRNTALADRHAALRKAATYMYRFDWQTPVLGGRLRTPHSLDLPFVFDNVQVSPGYSGGGGPDAAALAARVSEAWIAFARTGNPNTPKSGLPDWPAYDSDRRPAMLLNNTSRVAYDVAGILRKLARSGSG